MLDAAAREAVTAFAGGNLALARIGGEAIDVFSTTEGAVRLEVRVPASGKGPVRILVRDGREVPFAAALARGGDAFEFHLGGGLVETRELDDGLRAWLRRLGDAAAAARGAPFAFAAAPPPAP